MNVPRGRPGVTPDFSTSEFTPASFLTRSSQPPFISPRGEVTPGIGVVLSHFKRDERLSRGAHACLLHYPEISHESARRFSHKALSITNMVPTGCDTDNARSDMFFPVSFLSCEKLKSTRKRCAMSDSASTLSFSDDDDSSSAKFPCKKAERIASWIPNTE